MSGRRGRVLARLVAVIAVVAGVVLLPAAPAAAHPLGNFTVNHYTGLLVSPDHVEIDHVVDLAEIPTTQLGDAVDDLPAVAAEQCADVVGGLALTVAGRKVDLRVTDAQARLGDGQYALAVLRVECRLRGDFPALGADTRVQLRETVGGDRLGWREIVATGDRVTLDRSDVPDTSTSDRLSDYPTDLLTSPLEVRSATLTVSPGGVPATPGRRRRRPARHPGRRLDRGPHVAGGRPARRGRAERAAARPARGAGARRRARGRPGARQDDHGVLPGRPAEPLVASGPRCRHHRDRGAHVVGGGARARGRVRRQRAARAAVPGAHRGQRPAGARCRRRAGAPAVAGEAARARPWARSRARPWAWSRPRAGTATARSPPRPAGRGGLVTVGLAGGILPSPSALLLLLGAVALGRPWLGALLVLAFGVGMALTLCAAGLLASHDHRPGGATAGRPRPGCPGWRDSASRTEPPAGSAWSAPGSSSAGRPDPLTARFPVLGPAHDWPPVSGACFPGAVARGSASPSSSAPGPAATTAAPGRRARRRRRRPPARRCGHRLRAGPAPRRGCRPCGRRRTAARAPSPARAAAPVRRCR